MQMQMVFVLAQQQPEAAPVFKGATLVIADVSRGNVGQLASDLFITTMQMRCVGYFDDPDVLPAVGMEHGVLRVNTELFATKDASLFVLQQRSPAVPTREKAYGQRLASWIHANDFAKVIILSSLPAEMRKDQLLSSGGPQVSVGVGGRVGEARKKAELLGWRCVSFDADIPASDEEEWMHNALVRQEATPLARALLLHIASREGVEEGGSEALCIFSWTSEGNNIPDGIQMASLANDFLSVLPPNEQGQVGWKVPDSWRVVLTQNAPRPVYS